MPDEYIETGLRYCIRHDGVVDVDESECDFSDNEGDCDLRPLAYRR